jgi:hypothetical protein
MTGVEAVSAVVAGLLASSAASCRLRSPKPLYERCRTAPGIRLAEAGRIRPLTDELSSAPRGTERVRWNVNGPYVAGALNLLVASSSSSWPELCDAQQGVPSCVTIRSEKSILCNPAMGRELSEAGLPPEFESGAVLIAKRFLALTLLGHELAHLTMSDSPGVAHLLAAGTRVAELRCASEHEGPTVEERCDARGIELACSALRHGSLLRLLENTEESVLKLDFQLRNVLDDRYFQFDDTCVGDTRYPSISRRKHTFAEGLVSCVAPGALATELTADYAAAFKALERELHARQIDGFVVSPLFGLASSFAEEVVAEDGGSEANGVTFDSSGRSAMVLRFSHHAARTRGPVQRLLERWLPGLLDEPPRASTAFQEVASYAEVGTVVRSETAPGRVRLWMQLSGSTAGELSRRLVRLDVSSAATTTPPVATEPIVGARFAVAPDGAVLLATNDELRLFPSLNDMVERRKPIGTSRGALIRAGSPFEFPTAVDRTLAVAARSEGPALVVLESVVDARARALVLSDVPGPRAKLVGLSSPDSGRVVLIFRSDDLHGSGVELWDCPSALLREKRPLTSCRSFRGPETLSPSLVTLTHDMAALEAPRARSPRSGCDADLEIAINGHVWLLDERNGREDVLPGDGIVTCTADTVSVHRARRLDRLRLQWRAAHENPPRLLGTADFSSKP